MFRSRSGLLVHGDAGGVAPARQVAVPVSRALSGAPPGVTLLELLLVVALLGILAVVALPRLAESTIWQAAGDAGARQLVATLRLARRMAVDHAAENAVGYEVRCTATSYWIVDLSTNASEAETLLPDGWQLDDPACSVRFDPYGGAQPGVGGENHLGLHKESLHWTVFFEPSTGYVWCEES